MDLKGFCWEDVDGIDLVPDGDNQRFFECDNEQTGTTKSGGIS